MPRPGLSSCVLAALLPALVAVAVLPAELPRALGFDAVGLTTVVIGLGGLWRSRSSQRFPDRVGWSLLVAGYALLVLGDLTFTVQTQVLRDQLYPGPSDACYLASYLFVGAGLVALVRRRGARSVGAVLDAAVLAVGVGVLAVVFVISPVAADTTLSPWGRVISSAYPLADVLLLGVLVRLWAAPGGRTRASRLLGASLVLLLLGDAVSDLSSLLSGLDDPGRYADILWAAAYGFLAAAVAHPSVLAGDQPAGVAPADDPAVDPTRRLALLVMGLLLPALSLLGDGVSGQPVEWRVIGIGSLVLSGLVAARMAGLLAAVRAQADLLSALASRDALTGLANRRTWDHDLAEAAQTARDTGVALVVGLLDLDHFKGYNDTHGHQAGDRLLTRAAAAWSGLVRNDELLARYGGEEFALLLPGSTLDSARDRVEQMLGRTPLGQIFSAGLAVWDPTTAPDSAVAAADRALYLAKANGRNQVQADEGESAAEVVEAMRVAFQPIVDLGTGARVGVEALARFPGASTHQVFDRARAAGFGAELEAASITAARALRPPDCRLAVNVSLHLLHTPPMRAALAGDLTGVVLEVAEHSSVPVTDEAQVGDELAALRARGAVVAVDDWPRGFSTMDRLLWIKPEIIKLDISLTQALSSAHHRAAISVAVRWTDMVGARVCAEGIETEEQRQVLRDLGVALGQGFLFGRAELPPSVPDAASALAARS